MSVRWSPLGAWNWLNLAPAKYRQPGGPAAVPSHQSTLRTHLDHRHHQSRLRRMAERCSIASPTTAISSKPETTAGASRAVATITKPPALAPSPQPRPAPTARALPSGLVAQGGQNCTPIRGQICKPIDRQWKPRDPHLATSRRHLLLLRTA